MINKLSDQTIRIINVMYNKLAYQSNMSNFTRLFTYNWVIYILKEHMRDFRSLMSVHA